MGGYVDFKFSQIDGLGSDEPVKFLARIYEGDFVPIPVEQLGPNDKPGATQYVREKCLREITFMLEPGATVEDARAYMNARVAAIKGKQRLPAQITGGVRADAVSVKQPVPREVTVAELTEVGDAILGA